MTQKISWTLNVQVVGGPRIPDSQTIEVDAYDMLEVSIEDTAADKEVQLQAGASGVKFLPIKSDVYGDKLTYKVHHGAGATGPIKLDALQLLIGSGAVGLLGKAPVKVLFSNTQGKAASAQILVGRDATP
jgi:hypothetical protein